MEQRMEPRKASDWMVALLDAPDDAALRAGFTRWLAADPAHARDWKEIVRTYELMGMAAPLHRPEWAEAGGQGPRPVPAPSAVGKAGIAPSGGTVIGFPQRRRALALAVAAMAACLAVILLPDAALRLRADHMSARGQIMEVALEDGSRVRLAPESAITVDFAEGDRRVNLLAGRAFFEVKPDPAHPFRVFAGTVEATVLGTQFEVRQDGDAIAVAVREGRVGASTAGETAAAILTAGGWVRFAADGTRRDGTMDPLDVAAWMDGQLIARDLPVAEAVAELRRYHKGVVILRGEDLARQPLTGVYSLTDPDAALEAIAAAQEARLYRLSPWITLISGG
jgi:transmembrane sensor